MDTSNPSPPIASPGAVQGEARVDTLDPPPPPPVPPPGAVQSGARYFKTARKTFVHLELHFAINNGNVAQARHLVRSGINLNYIISGNTPLTLAILQEQYEIAEVLVDAQAQVSLPEQTKWRRYPIHLVAKQGNLPLLKKLIAHGASVDISEQMGFTPLHWACIGHQVEVVRYLLAQTSHVDCVDDVGRTPLHRAAEENHPDNLAIIATLLRCGADVNARDSHGWTPLFQPIVCNFTEVVQELLSQGADANATSYHGTTPLHLVAGGLREDIMIIMSRTGINYYIRSRRGASQALHVARRNAGNEVAMAYLLLDAGADVNRINGDMETAIHIAATEGEIELLQLFVQAGADLCREPWIIERRWPEKLAVYTDVCDWLIQQSEVVKHLETLCKAVIRTALVRNINLKIELLPLPQRIKNFLTL